MASQEEVNEAKIEMYNAIKDLCEIIENHIRNDGFKLLIEREE